MWGPSLLAVFINEVLHNMISHAEQAPDVRLVDPDASDEEEYDKGE